MKPYGLKNKICDPHGYRKVASHVRKGNNCPICNNFKVVKKSERQKANKAIRDQLN